MTYTKSEAKLKDRLNDGSRSTMKLIKYKVLNFRYKYQLPQNKRKAQILNTSFIF